MQRANVVYGRDAARPGPACLAEPEKAKAAICMCNAAALPADAIVNILLGSHVIHPRGAAQLSSKESRERVIEVPTV
jgi:hypothetical protein